ncbi:MAG TPA: xanthine dehydrogenase family protein molybdopterin-binding subunit [Anaeromyxobacteraceae bacterium]|nr:xanthine dehydrogenase family protein molybdopterin-binding subunit [Anaeromyxobacteraceae bacterium]
MTAPGLSRREFLALSAGGGAALWLSVALPERAAAGGGAALEPNAWLRIDEKGAVTIFLAKAEMGQGVYTAMPLLVAEELEADWRAIQVVQADAHPRFGTMVTGGSSSVRRSFGPLREAGAAARELLVAAAARRWGVPAASCRAAQGAVLHPDTGRRLGYGALVADAAKLPVPAAPALKDPKDWKLLGRRVARLDTPAKTHGRAVFGLDVRVPGMRHAVVARPPVMGGKVVRFDGSKALRVRGVERVVQVPSGVAVVAASTWAAIQGREALDVTFDPGPNGKLDQAAIARILAEAPLLPTPARAEGDVEKALASAARRLEATYELPLLAHATMEPMSCTAHVTRGAVEIWAPTQAPSWAVEPVARALGIAPAKVTLHTTFLGGGFGRRAMPDFVLEAVQVSKAVGGPVQVTWTREDDMRHDFYRPPGRNELRAGLDAAGRLVAWHHRVRTPSARRQIFGGPPPGPGERPDVAEGAADVPYAAGAILVDCAAPELGVPLGFWRSVYSSQNAFPEECFIDEVAAAAGKDPLEFRLALMAPGSRLRAALALAAEKAGWGTPPPAGRARGLACHSSFGSHVAEVAEVSLEKGRLRVHRVTCAVDCGLVVTPDAVEAQIEGAVVYGLSAALRGEITVKDGAVVQGNFDDYEPLRMDEMPAVEVHLVPSAEPPGGVGEPGVPPIAPAVANALFALTGKRHRRLPLRDLG